MKYDVRFINNLCWTRIISKIFSFKKTSFAKKCFKKCVNVINALNEIKSRRLKENNGEQRKREKKGGGEPEGER